MSLNTVERMIDSSGLDFLKEVEFEEITPGRFFQKDPVDFGSGYRQFYVVLGPGIESPVHDHADDPLEEAHLLLFGGGYFVVYDDAGRETERIILKRGMFHPIFSTLSETPKHKYVADPKQGSITLAVDRRAR